MRIFPYLNLLKWLCTSALLLILPSLAPVAQAARAYEPSFAYERDHQSFVVASDGSYRFTQDRTVRIQTAAGIESEGIANVYYNADRQEVESIQAWTIQPDGTQIEVSKDAIHTRDDSEGESATSISDAKRKLIIFPKVQVGSRLRFIVTINCHTAQFPGHFLKGFIFVRAFAEEDFRVDLDLPADKPLYTELRGAKGELLETRDGRSRYRFTYRRTSANNPDPESVDETDVADLLRLSTVPDPVAYGRLYQASARPMAAVTDAVRAKALEITRNSADAKSKVRALHHWVASNIRYISVALADGALVPRSADSVLKNLYGDCKDHVVLLEAMLDAVGIRSSPALINSGRAYTLSTIGIGGPINHVITYVPQLDLYIDSTDPHSPFGTIPFDDMDKPVILTALDKVARTPALNAADHSSTTRIKLSVRADGSIEGMSESDQRGIMQSRSRASRSAALGYSEKTEVKRLLDRFGETGTGAIEHSDPDDLNEPFVLTSTFVLDPIANVPGPAAMTIPVGLASGKLRGIVTDKPQETFTGPYVCESGTVREFYTLRFAPNIRIQSIPQAMRHKDEAIDYRADYRRSGQTVTVSRELAVQFAGSVCGERDLARWKTFFAKLQRDLRSQVVYR